MAREYPKTNAGEHFKAGTSGWGRQSADSRSGYGKAAAPAQSAALPVQAAPATFGGNGGRAYPKGGPGPSPGYKHTMAQQLPSFYDGGAFGETPGEATGSVSAEAEAAAAAGAQAESQAGAEQPAGPSPYDGGGTTWSGVDWNGNEQPQGPSAYEAAAIADRAGEPTYGGMGDHDVYSGNSYDFTGVTPDNAPVPDLTGPMPADNPDAQIQPGYKDNPEPDWTTFNPDHMPSRTLPDKTGRMVDPTEVRNQVYNAANKRGMDPQRAFDLVQIESKFNPKATNSLGYKGIAQIGGQFAKQYNVKDPYDTVEALDAMGRNQQAAKKSFDKAGLAMAPVDTYMAHQQGISGARSLAKADPNARAVDVLGFDEVKGNMPPGAKEKGYSASTITAQQFRDAWNDHMTNRTK